MGYSIAFLNIEAFPMLYNKIEKNKSLLNEQQACLFHP